MKILNVFFETNIFARKLVQMLETLFGFRRCCLNVGVRVCAFGVARSELVFLQLCFQAKVLLENFGPSLFLKIVDCSNSAYHDECSYGLDYVQDLPVLSSASDFVSPLEDVDLDLDLDLDLDMALDCLRQWYRCVL